MNLLHMLQQAIGQGHPANNSGNRLNVQPQHGMNGSALREPNAPVVYPSTQNRLGTQPVSPQGPQMDGAQQLQAHGYPTQRLQADYTPWQNMGQLRNMINPQVSDNGFYYY